MPPHRDVAAFEDRATGYQEGWRGRLHHDIAGRTAVLALSASTAPRRVLDIGCGTGYLLRLLARQWPQATELAGIDPAPSMIEAAAGRLATSACGSPSVPPNGCPAPAAPLIPRRQHDVVRPLVRPAGRPARMRQSADARRPSHSRRPVHALAHPYAGRRPSRKARTPRQADQLLSAAGFKSIAWHDLNAIIITAVKATT